MRSREFLHLIRHSREVFERLQNLWYISTDSCTNTYIWGYFGLIKTWMYSLTASLSNIKTLVKHKISFVFRYELLMSFWTSKWFESFRRKIPEWETVQHYSAKNKITIIFKNMENCFSSWKQQYFEMDSRCR